MEQAGSLKGWDYCTALSLQYMDQLPWETEDNCCWTPRWRTNCSHRWTVDFFTDTMNTTWLCITSSRILAGSGNFTFFLLCGPSLPDSLKTTDHLKKSPVWYSERSNLEFWRKVTAAFVLWLWNCYLYNLRCPSAALQHRSYNKQLGFHWLWAYKVQLFLIRVRRVSFPKTCISGPNISLRPERKATSCPISSHCTALCHFQADAFIPVLAFHLKDSQLLGPWGRGPWRKPCIPPGIMRVGWQ